MKMKTLFALGLSLALNSCLGSEERIPLLSRALLHNTVRLETEKSDGTIHTGTGFFYVFQGLYKTSSCPVIVTCWHLVDGSTNGRIYFAQGSSNVWLRAKDH